MNENIESADQHTTTSELQKPSSAGALLRNAREAEGLHIAALAVSLKVPTNKIEALEADRLELLPDLAFARALASSICRVLKIDSVAILSQMPVLSAPPMKTDESGINAPFRVPGESSGFAAWRQLSKPLVLAVAALLVGALALLLPVFSPTSSVVDTSASGADEAATPQLNVPPPADGIVPSSNVAVLPATNLSAPDISPVSSMPNVEVTSSPGSSSAVLEVSAPTIDGSGLATGLLVLKARDASWVQVIDAAGVVQVRKTLQAGDVVGVTGTPPLTVVLGRADVIDVQVRGLPFEVARRANENIARFEVR